MIYRYVILNFQSKLNSLKRIDISDHFIIHSLLNTYLYATLLSLLKSAETFFSLPTSTFKPAKSNFAAKSDIPKPFFITFSILNSISFLFAIHFYKTFQQLLHH